MLSIMNEIDPCLLLPLCVLFEMQNQIYQQKAPRFDFGSFLSVKYIHKSIKMLLVILKFKDQGQKRPQSNKIDL